MDSQLSPYGLTEAGTQPLKSLCENSSSAPSGLAHIPLVPHGLRGGLYSCAASRLTSVVSSHSFSKSAVLTQILKTYSRCVNSRKI